MSLLSENLKLLHLESGLSFEELSERTGIDVILLKAFENEKLVPNEFQLEELCRVLKFPFEDINDRNLGEESVVVKQENNTIGILEIEKYFGFI